MHLICDMSNVKNAICVDPFMLWTFTYAACLNACMIRLENGVCFNSFTTRAKMVPSESLFIVPSWLSDMEKLILRAQNFIWYAKNHLLIFGNCYYLVMMITHGFGQWSKLHKIPAHSELWRHLNYNVKTTDFQFHKFLLQIVLSFLLFLMSKRQEIHYIKNRQGVLWLHSWPLKI